MGAVGSFTKENLIIGVLSTEENAESGLKTELEAELGPIDFSSTEIDFNFTSYYDAEMGPGIKRRFYSFLRLIDPSDLPRIKRLTNEIEQEHTVEGLRKINLDPGMLDLNRLVLATTKNVGHRIPLQDGIYGEVTLLYMKKNFHPLDWTYPDYQSPEYIEILKKIRIIYRAKLNQKN